MANQPQNIRKNISDSNKDIYTNYYNSYINEVRNRTTVLASRLTASALTKKPVLYQQLQDLESTGVGFISKVKGYMSDGKGGVSTSKTITGYRLGTERSLSQQFNEAFAEWRTTSQQIIDAIYAEKQKTDPSITKEQVGSLLFNSDDVSAAQRTQLTESLRKFSLLFDDAYSALYAESGKTDLTYSIKANGKITSRNVATGHQVSKTIAELVKLHNSIEVGAGEKVVGNWATLARLSERSNTGNYSLNYAKGVQKALTNIFGTLGEQVVTKGAAAALESGLSNIEAEIGNMKNMTVSGSKGLQPSGLRAKSSSASYAFDFGAGKCIADAAIQIGDEVVGKISIKSSATTPTTTTIGGVRQKVGKVNVKGYTSTLKNYTNFMAKDGFQFDPKGLQVPPYYTPLMDDGSDYAAQSAASWAQIMGYRLLSSLNKSSTIALKNYLIAASAKEAFFGFGDDTVTDYIIGDTVYNSADIWDGIKSIINKKIAATSVASEWGGTIDLKFTGGGDVDSSYNIANAIYSKTKENQAASLEISDFFLNSLL